MKYIWFLFISISAYSQDYFGVQFVDNLIDTTILPGSENARYSDVWGFEYASQKYAVIGSTIGSHFIKVGNNSLKEIDFHKGAFSSPTVQHRDYKKYNQFIYGVCDEGNSSLQIFDVSYLPDSVVKVYDSDMHFSICHNLFIDTLNAKLYACGPNNTGLKILDISNPVQPELLVDFNGVDYVHDCYVRNDTAFLNAGFQGLEIYFFGGAMPKQLGALGFYPEQGYNHSGWLSNDGQGYCFIDETKGKKIKYCELKDGLENIEITALFGTKDASEYVPHNVMISNGFAVVSYYNEGLRIFDLKSKPIREIGHYDTFPLETDYKLNGAWGVFLFNDDYILISDRQFGLFLFKFPFSTYRSNYPVVNAPFINSESLILFQAAENPSYQFSIYTVSGQKIYHQERFGDWINIPLSLSSGAYVYGVFDAEGVKLDAGKFIVQK